jgi:uncharacterized membrane protein YfcA
MLWPALLLFGMAIGLVSGLMGIGGGVLLVPGLILLFGFTQAEAQGTSLAVMIPPIGLFAAIVYYQHGYIRLPVVGFIAVGFLMGAYLGALLVPQIPPALLRLAFGILFLYLGFVFLMNPSDRRTSVALPAGVAAVVTAVMARLLRRRGLLRREVSDSGEGPDYHI